VEVGNPLTTDVAIVGAGPAGSTLAALLAERGIGTILIDRDEFPRDKLCGEFLSYDALPVLDALGVTRSLDASGCPTIRRGRIVGRRGAWEFDLPRAARGVSRLLLDDLLLRRAEAAGAVVRSGWTAVELSANAPQPQRPVEPHPFRQAEGRPQRTGGNPRVSGAEPRSTVVIERDGVRVPIDAGVLIGAWGRWGRFDLQLGRSFVRDRTHRHFGFKRHYRAKEARDTAGIIDLYSYADGYLGVSPVEGNEINICGLVRASRLSGHLGGWPRFVEEIAAEEEHLADLFEAHIPSNRDFVASEPVIFRGKQPVAGGIILVGDASGIVDPLAGNGMAMAIQSALIAAPVVTGIVTNPGSRRHLERVYTAAHRDLFTPRIRWSRTAGWMLSRPALLELALRVAPSRSTGRFLASRTRGSYETVSRLTEQWFQG
jgi:flavin-dependent dehydrogenase